MSSYVAGKFVEKKLFLFFKKGVDKQIKMCYYIKAVNAGVAE